MKLTTLGVQIAYGIETTIGEKPATFYKLDQCSSISGLDLSTEQIDVSDLASLVTEYAAGRQDTGGSWNFEFILDPDKSVKQIKKLYADSKTARQSGKATWFEVVFPDMSDAFFVIAETGNAIPLPEIGQNTAATLPVSLVVSKYIGLDAKVDPSENAA